MTYPSYLHTHPELSRLEVFQRELEMMTTDFQTFIDTFSKAPDRQFTPLSVKSLNPNDKKDILQVAVKVAELRPTESHVKYLIKDLEQKQDFIRSLEDTKAGLGGFAIPEETEKKLTNLLKAFSDFHAQIHHRKNQIDEELQTLMEFWEKTPRRIYLPEVYARGSLYNQYITHEKP